MSFLFGIIHHDPLVSPRAVIYNLIWFHSLTKKVTGNSVMECIQEIKSMHFNLIWNPQWGGLGIQIKIMSWCEMGREYFLEKNNLETWKTGNNSWNTCLANNFTLPLSPTPMKLFHLLSKLGEKRVAGGSSRVKNIVGNYTVCILCNFWSHFNPGLWNGQ